MARKRRYQSGGLAEYTGAPFDYNEDDVDLEGGNLNPGALAQYAAPDDGSADDGSTPASEEIVAGAMPDSLQKARALNKMSRDEAIARLTAGRDALMQKKYDPSAKWLALAQGMLAPTKTGGFGESLGNAAGRIGEVVKDTQDYNTGHEKQLLDLEAEMAKAQESYSARDIDILQAEEVAKSRAAMGARGVSFPGYIDDPDNPGHEILARMIVNTGKPGSAEALLHDGRVIRVPDNLDPTTRGNVAQAVTLGTINPKDLGEQIDKARVAKDRLASTYFGLDILKRVRKAGGTGGIQNYVQQIREVFGSEAKDVADRGQLMAMMGDQLFAALEAFGTQINEEELKTAKQQLAAGGTRSTAVNERLLQQLATKLEAQVSLVQGLAKDHGDGYQAAVASQPLTDYGLDPTTRQRAEKLGFKFQPYAPFESEEVKVVKPRKPGEQGHVGTPWQPKTNAAINALLRNPETVGAQAGDFFQIPDPKNPGKILTLQVK